MDIATTIDRNHRPATEAGEEPYSTGPRLERRADNGITPVTEPSVTQVQSEKQNATRDLDSNRPSGKHGSGKAVVLAARFGGKTYTTGEWSMGGFDLDDYDGDLASGALITISALGRSDGELNTVDLPARVTRTGARAITVNFLSLDAGAYAFLQDAMRDSGKMRSLLKADAT